MSETITPPNGNIKRFRLNKWRQRYALIEDNKYLCVYVDKSKKKLEDKIEISQTKFKSIHDTPIEFQVETIQKKYFFQCDTNSDTEIWIQNLQFIKNNNTIKFHPNRARKSVSDEEKDEEKESQIDQYKVAANLYNVVLTPQSQSQKGFKTFRSQTMFINSNNEQKTNYEFSKTPTNTSTPSAYPNTDNISMSNYNKSRPDKIINYATIATPISPNIHHNENGSNSRTDASEEEIIINNIPIIDKIDIALQKYYNFFANVSYFTSDGIGKFKSFCEEEYDGDNEEIKKEIEENIHKPDDCGLIAFDEDENDINLFPLEFENIEPNKINIEIFKVIYHCYRYGIPPAPILQFDKDDFYYVMEPFKRKGKIKNNNNNNKNQKGIPFAKSVSLSIIMKPKSEFMKQTEMGLELNLTKSDDCMIQIKNLTRELRELIGISMHGDNHLFKYDFASLLIDSYHRYCIIKQINNNSNRGPFIGNILNKMNKIINNKKYMLSFEQFIWLNEYDTDSIINDIYSNQNQSNILNNNNEIKEYILNNFNDIKNINNNNSNEEMYGQMYWFAQPDKILKRRKVVSSVQRQLEEAYDVVKNKNDTCDIILIKNGEIIRKSNGKHISELSRIAQSDYNNQLFRFMSSNGFYWSLISKNKSKSKKNKYSLHFFESAFKNYANIICGPLTLLNMNKIHDNIFIFWVYIWSMSRVVKSYMQSGNITIPLQIDLLIIPNNYCSSDDMNDLTRDLNIFERFKIHDQIFHHSICDSTKILSIAQTLESILTQCRNDNDDIQNDRIILIIDRRTRDEYKGDNGDHIFSYKPPNKYAQIDEEHEILNSIWNTSKFLIPPPTNYKHEELSGAQSNNLFVVSYIIRKKSQFIHLFDQQDCGEMENMFDDDFDDDLDDDIESQYSEDSIGKSTRRSLRTKTDITQRKFDSKAARDFVPHLRKHKELTTLMLVALFEKVAEKTKKAIDTKELAELQNIQTFIMKLLMNRKRDSTVNTYLFYNYGYVRFEPYDLIRILPSFFNINQINNFYNQMLINFRQYHEKLWELDDLIWMEYKRLYLQSNNAMNQQISIQNIGTDHKDRLNISKLCKWNKTKNIININAKMDSKKIMQLYEMVKLRSQKSLDLFRIIKRENRKIEINLLIDIRKFLILSKSKSTVHGIKIKQIEKNDFGDLFKETGVKNGWYINSIGGESIEYGTINKFNNIMDEIMELNQSYKVIFIKTKQKKYAQRKRTDSLIKPSHAKKSSNIQITRNRANNITNSNSHIPSQSQPYIPSLNRLKSPQTLHVDIIEEDIQNEENNMLISSQNNNNNIKSCPNCKTQRKQPHVKVWRMQCHKCRNKWCWQCNQLWNNKSYQDVLHCGNKNCPTYMY